jgi:redox-sensitive bicupin YhaK (pirin superfamily)
LSIKPGELNLMTAGRGIVHSERTSPEERAKGPRLFGIQAWAALPKSHEEEAPTFAHYDASDLPRVSGDGKTVRIVMGSLLGETSPAAYPHACFYAEAVLAPGATLPLDPDYDERGIFIASGEIDIAGETFAAGRLLVFRPGDRISILALSQARLMLLGGEPMDGPRHIWWNFVSSSKDRIDAAKADWKAKRFASVPGDAAEFIPLPE